MSGVSIKLSACSSKVIFINIDVQISNHCVAVSVTYDNIKINIFHYGLKHQQYILVL